jgi:uncharacterized protein (DUF433 family)
MGRISIPIKDPVTVDKSVLGGIPVIRGTRIPASLVFELLNRGYTTDLISKEYPSLSEKKIAAFLKLVSGSFDVASFQTV